MFFDVCQSSLSPVQWNCSTPLIFGILLTKQFLNIAYSLMQNPTFCYRVQGYLTEVCVCHLKFTSEQVGIYLSMPTLCQLATSGSPTWSSVSLCPWRARYFFSHYGIMYSSNMAKTSQFQSLPLHRGSGFVELCFLAKGTEANLLGTDQHGP